MAGVTTIRLHGTTTKKMKGGVYDEVLFLLLCAGK
jgi:hypothetical protein